jgi:hypothetical protein
MEDQEQDNNSTTSANNDDTVVLSPNPIDMTTFQVVDKVFAFRMTHIPAHERNELISMLKIINDSDSDDTASVVTSTSVSSYNSSDEEKMTQLQCDQWKARYTELVEYQQMFGNCHIPYDWAPNKPLSQWVKRQRHQRRLRQEGKHSNLTDEREKLLNDLGFVWDSRAANWDERHEELVMFKVQHGHCKVTSKYGKAYRPLAVWLKRQRHAVREFVKGKEGTGMTDERVSRLVDVGVNMNVRRSK